jgi:transcriptional regulator of acetoin/glycerol metabolism
MFATWNTCSSDLNSTRCCSAKRLRHFSLAAVSRMSDAARRLGISRNTLYRKERELAHP